MVEVMKLAIFKQTLFLLLRQRSVASVPRPPLPKGGCRVCLSCPSSNDLNPLSTKTSLLLPVQQELDTSGHSRDPTCCGWRTAAHSESRCFCSWKNAVALMAVSVGLHNQGLTNWSKCRLSVHGVSNECPQCQAEHAHGWNQTCQPAVSVWDGFSG